MSNKIILLLLLLLAIPLAYAEEGEEEKCGITNLATRIPEKFYSYTLGIINMPLQPFLSMVIDLSKATLIFTLYIKKICCRG